MWLYLPELKRVEQINYWLNAIKIESDYMRSQFKNNDPVFTAVREGKCHGIISSERPEPDKKSYLLYDFSKKSPFYGYDTPYLFNSSVW